MRLILRFATFILLLPVVNQSFAQFNLKHQVPVKVTYEPAKVIDSTYGIIIYEGLNAAVQGDSTRMCGNYACQSWLEDFYVSGQLLHKGFYLDGQLKSYKNYYPDGVLERDFKNVDNYRSSAKLFYPSAKLKSDIKYNDGMVEAWIDYNEAGMIIYDELMDKGMVFHTYKRVYFENGKPEQIMELKDKKKMTYDYTEYHENGQIKSSGEKIYSDDYLNNGKWKYFDESGKLIKEEEFAKGEKMN